MIITKDGTELEVIFTFNSFRYMEDFSLKQLAELDDKPFKVIGVIRQLLFGGLNCSPNKRFSLKDADEITEYIAENDEFDVGEVLTDLMKELENSNFFKQLQKKPKKKATK